MLLFLPFKFKTKKSIFTLANRTINLRKTYATFLYTEEKKWQQAGSEEKNNDSKQNLQFECVCRNRVFVDDMVEFLGDACMQSRWLLSTFYKNCIFSVSFAPRFGEHYFCCGYFAFYNN